MNFGMLMKMFSVCLFKNICHRMVPCMSCRDTDNDQSLVMNSTQENTGTSFCRNCRLRRSVNDLEKLINGAG
jgi:hypothetical protein